MTERDAERTAMDDITGPAKVLRIYIGESDKWHGRPLATALVERLRAEGLAGATVIRAVEGFGANSRIHTAHILRLSEDLPLVVECVDRAERIERILPLVDEMVGDGMVTLSDVTVVHYRHAKDT
jgi:PII-like signaling protein